MIKALVTGVAASLLLPLATAAAPRPAAPAWVILPGAQDCRVELELVGASGAITPAALVSGGQSVDLVFTKADAPERAFLPIRIDQKPYANLVLRQTGGASATMQLSAETLAALAKGGAMQIGWLAEEPVHVGLAGSGQALSDLRTCGLQVAERHRASQAAERERVAQAEAEARARALADEQLAVVKAQKAAAEAEARRSAAEAERLRAAAEADRMRAQAEADAARQRAEQQARMESWPYPRARDYPEAPPEPYEPPGRYRRYEPPVAYGRW